MKTVQMTLDEELLAAVDELANQLHTSRSALTRRALHEALERHKVREQEELHRRGYRRHPVASNEFALWEGEQVWGDE